MKVSNLLNELFTGVAQKRIARNCARLITFSLYGKKLPLMTCILKSLNHNNRISTCSFWRLFNILKNNVNALKTMQTASYNSFKENKICYFTKMHTSFCFCKRTYANSKTIKYT